MRILDLERASKITGARFAVYWGAGARLERALINFMLDVHTREHGYTEVLPPFLINSASMFGTGQLPKFKEDSVQDRESRFLARADGGSAGHQPVSRRNSGIGRTAHLAVRLHAVFPQRGRILRTRCARHHPAAPVPESGAGEVRAVRNKATTELEKLTCDAEDILKRLGLPFRTVALSTGDMGAASAKTYDLEVWLPGQNDYQGNFILFELRGVSGAARLHSNQIRQGQSRIRSHLERQRTGDRAHLGGDRRKLPAGRWQHPGAGCAAALPGGRAHPSRVTAVPLKFSACKALQLKSFLRAAA